MMAFGLSPVLLANDHIEPNVWPIRLKQLLYFSRIAGYPPDLRLPFPHLKPIQIRIPFQFFPILPLL
jgi:hypothetical protein